MKSNPTDLTFTISFKSNGYFSSHFHCSQRTLICSPTQWCVTVANNKKISKFGYRFAAFLHFRLSPSPPSSFSHRWSAICFAIRPQKCRSRKWGKTSNQINLKQLTVGRKINCARFCCRTDFGGFSFVSSQSFAATWLQKVGVLAAVFLFPPEFFFHSSSFAIF